MSMFYCHRCDNHVDSDWIPCAEDPDGEFWLMCDEHEEKCARCDQALGKDEDRLTDDLDPVCDSCWDKVACHG